MGVFGTLAPSHSRSEGISTNAPVAWPHPIPVPEGPPEIAQCLSIGWVGGSSEDRPVPKGRPNPGETMIAKNSRGGVRPSTLARGHPIRAVDVQDFEPHLCAMKGEFTAIIEEAPEGGYWAICPEVSGANGQGDTIEDAKASLGEAIRLIIEDRLEDVRRGLPSDAIQSVIVV